MNDNVEVWLWLLLVMGPHNPRTVTALRAGGYDLKRTCVQMREGKYEFLRLEEMERVQSVRLGQVRALQQLCAENDISIITIDNPDYPEKLKYIANPPIVLFVQGDIACLKQDGKPRQTITAIGTRTCSEYSLDTTRKLCQQFAKAGACVVSGLATGLDTAAHSAVLDSKAEGKGTTLGVLACGNLVNYPAESAELKKRIIRSGGAVISELLPETLTPKGYFDMRNRILAGISDCVVVLEASEKSGTLLTAKHAFNQRKRVFFIPPHNIAESRYNGAEILYEQGAAPLFSYKNALAAVSWIGVAEKAEPFSRKTPVQKPETWTADTLSSADKPKRTSTRKAKSAETEPVETVEPVKPEKPDYSKPIPEGLSELETKVYKELLKSPADSDLLVIRTSTNYRDIMDALVNLELDGIVSRSADGTYSLSE